MPEKSTLMAHIIDTDEAYLYLKSMGLSWSTLAPTGLIEYILKGMDFFGSSAFQLRLPSIIFIISSYWQNISIPAVIYCC